MDTTKTITHVSLCAGYGGIDLGLGRAIPNLRSVAFSEIEAFACANLVSKMEAGLLDAAPIWTNIKTFPWSDFRDRVDILSGGYPCQPFSAAGKRLGRDDPRHLWPWIADGIRAMRPRICFFENVEGHISLGLREVIGELEGLGYQTAWGIFSAREVGAPHQRKRVFILAHDKRQRIEKLGWKISVQSQQHPARNAGCNAVWPSRPGEPQHGWEPPRVVANTESERTRRETRCGGSETKRQGQSLSWEFDSTSERSVVGNSTSKRSCGGSEDGTNQQPEMLGTGHEAMGNTSQLQCNGSDHHARDLQQSEEVSKSGDSSWEAMGNAECIRIPTSREHGAMDEASGIPADGERSELAQADSESSPSRKREGDGINASECCQAQPALGRDADGAAYWMDDAELYTTCDNRTDELRLLGNGVVPATAERAFRTLLTELLTNKTNI